VLIENDWTACTTTCRRLTTIATKKQPIPFYTSPMGPMGLLQGTLIYTGTRLMGFLQWIQDNYGMSPMVAGVVVCGLGIFGGMVSIILLTILTTPKAKND
jgi:hypothetical protein